MNETEIKKLAATYTREEARSRLLHVANELIKASFNIEEYIERFDSAENDAHRARIVNWALSHLVCNIQTNLRIDLLANSQAALANTGL